MSGLPFPLRFSRQFQIYQIIRFGILFRFLYLNQKKDRDKHHSPCKVIDRIVVKVCRNALFDCENTRLIFLGTNKDDYQHGMPMVRINKNQTHIVVTAHFIYSKSVVQSEKETNVSVLLQKPSDRVAQSPAWFAFKVSQSFLVHH